MFIAELLIIAKKCKQLKCPSTDKWINKLAISIQWNIIQPWKGIKYGHSYNLDDPWKCDAHWQKPDTKDHVLYDSVYEVNPDNPQMRKPD